MPQGTFPRISRKAEKQMEGTGTFEDVDEYNAVRRLLTLKEISRAYDSEATELGTNLERKAAWIVQQVQEDDRIMVYRQNPYPNGNPRYIGAPFLENLDLINQSRTLEIAQHMPKGSHLHIHYNACLPARYLVEHARNIAAMYIKSSLPLTSAQNMVNAEIQFQVLPPPAIVDNLFLANYVANAWMPYSQFLNVFQGGQVAAETWLISKLTFTEDLTHGQRQTVRGIWDEFAKGTRMMKGLFGYESAFRDYTRELIRSFVDDGILYAELRPNFPANVMIQDDAQATINNADLCQIIIDEVNNAKANLVEGEYFHGVKIIYCAPKILPPATDMAANLRECLELKQRFPDLICGFDLVGPEETMQVIHQYIPELLEFKAECRRLKIDIPFIFHAGETLQNGGPVDSNLMDALMLGCPRIGHGFALAWHPELMELFKKRNIALEVCPIGNEILHLTPAVAGHAMNILLANDVHCTLNCDNSVFYSSTLSHDFYQQLISSPRNTIFGWKVLAKWSLEHSCLNRTDKAEVTAEWEARWGRFMQWIVDHHVLEAAAWDAAHPNMTYNN